MDSSNSSSSYNPMTNYANPFPENDINLEERPYYPMMFNFPNSPQIHLEYEEAYLQFLDLLHQYQSSNPDRDNIPAIDHYQDNATGIGHDANMIKSTVDVINQRSTITKKRCSKKDRHSKINTIHGPRDRRMRLSLDVARKFFDLQDMLGYDKASRTVEWLLNNSKPAIRELERSKGSVCSASSPCVDDCNVVSSSINQSTTVGPNQEPLPTLSSSCSKIKRIKKIIIKVARAGVSRESRTKARERARERTSQKRRLRPFRVISGTDCEGEDNSLVYTKPVEFNYVGVSASTASTSCRIS